jgi:hypothetical protein
MATLRPYGWPRDVAAAGGTGDANMKMTDWSKWAQPMLAFCLWQESPAADGDPEPVCARVPIHRDPVPVRAGRSRAQDFCRLVFRPVVPKARCVS